MTSASLHFKGHYDLHGRGAPILALAGLGCSNWLFKDLSVLLQDVGQWIMPDNRGMGQSPPARAPYEMEDLAQDALALMDDLGHEHFGVVGISMGGFVAQTLARKAPERVSNLVLMCTTGPGNDFVPLPAFPEELIRGSYTMDPQSRTSVNLQGTTYPGFAEKAPDAYRAIFKEKLRNIPDVEQLVLQNAAAIRFTRGTMDYSRISCPTLVMSGEHDRFVHPENAYRLAQKIPEARVSLIPETDHLFFLEKPERVAQTIREFLEAS